MNLVSAVTELARPCITYACGFGVAAAVFMPHPNPEVVAIAAGVATGVSYFRSQDKRAGVGNTDTVMVQDTHISTTPTGRG